MAAFYALYPRLPAYGAVYAGLYCQNGDNKKGGLVIVWYAMSGMNV